MYLGLMDPSRRRFLIRGAQVSGALTVGGLAFASAKTNGETVYEAVPLYAAYLRGVQYRNLPPSFLQELKPGETVTLLRESGNKYDKRAIAAHIHDMHCGYLPREDNLVFSRLLDAGLPLVCAATIIDAQAEPWRQLGVTVSLLYPVLEGKPFLSTASQSGGDLAPPLEPNHSIQAQPQPRIYIPHPSELTEDEDLQRALTTAAGVGVLPLPRAW